MVEIASAEVEPDTEIRKLSGRLINGLCQILESNGDWEKLMSEIRLDIFNFDDIERKYTPQDIKVVAEAGERHSSCTEIFLNEWGTSGRKRPTVRLLYDYLKKINLIKAADYIGTKFLNLPEIPELPPFDDCSILDIPTKIPETSFNDESHHNRSTVKQGMYILEPTDECHEYTTNIPEESSNRTGTDSTVLEGGSSISREYLSELDFRIGDHVERIPFSELRISTENFDQSCRLGKGAFGSVYLGSLYGVDRAIKVLENCAEEQFERELAVLGNISHPRLLSPVAVSIDEVLCLIYPYMSHGSLEDRLALKNKELLPLEWRKRMTVASNIIEGLRYLHTRPQPIVHRDIKTSNILLDEADVAKIGDFGLIREKNDQVSALMVSSVEGTDAYMAPEAYRFQCTPKLDVYSYGMILLELLTGLPIIDEEKGHLKDLIEEELEDENNDIIKLVDKKAGDWIPEIANELYVLANNCLAFESKKRFNSTDVEKHINDLLEKVSTQ